MPPRVGQSITVRGCACKIIVVYSYGTIDVASDCGRYFWRVSGLAFT